LGSFLETTGNVKERVVDLDLIDGVWEDVVIIKAVFGEFLEDFDF